MIRGTRAGLLGILLLCACGNPRAKESEEPVRIPVQAAAESPCEPVTFEGSLFTVCTFDSRNDQIELRWTGKDGHPLRSFERLESELGPEAQSVRFAMNAGMYDEAGGPIGLYVAEGKQLKAINLNDGPGNFHMKPNGIFAVARNGTVSITPSNSFARGERDAVWATQSGPMLVIDEKIHPKFDTDGQSRLVRNGVGVRDPNLVIFAISEEGVSFGRFARLFRDRLGCANALFLDGSVSSLWDPANARRDAYSRLGPMIVVFKGEKPRA